MVRFAIAIARGWTRLYTWSMPARLRDERRAEIESDMWEFLQDSDDRRSPGAQILFRLVMGVPDDLGWRIEQAVFDCAPLRRSIALTARVAGATLFLCALLVIDADASRKRADILSPPAAAVSQESLPLLAAGVAVVIGGSLPPARPAQAATATPSPPTFEVASIKPNKSGSPILGIDPAPGGRLTATNVSLGALIRYGYQLPIFRMSGGPDWIESERFDLVAKAEGEAGPDQIRLMLRRLLAERFALKVHTETREQPIFELLVARGDGRIGPQLRRSTVDCAGVPPPRPGTFPAGSPPVCGFVGPAPDIAVSTGRARFALRGMTMEGVARFLQGAVRRQVVDRTGLIGYFDGEFDFTVEIPPPPPPPGIPDPYDRLNFPTIFTVVREQLGLKLESSRGPVEILVVEAASRPTPD